MASYPTSSPTSPLLISLCKMRTNCSSSCSSIVVPCLLSQQKPLYSSSNINFKSSPSLIGGGFGRLSVKCSSNNRPPFGPGSGENDSSGVLDAFFLGKALAEAINERIESTVGEVLSVVGRLQAEQQKQVQEFQEDVLERAKRAKEKAAREAIEAQGLAPKSAPIVISTASDVASPEVLHSPDTIVTPVTSASSSSAVANGSKNNSTAAVDPFIGMLNEDDD